MTSLLYVTKGVFTDEDAPEWMWEIARSRPGYYRINVPVYSSSGELRRRSVNFSQKEYKDMDNVITNQMLAEPKDKTFRSLVFQRANMVWPGATDDHISMKTLAPWAMSCYKTQPTRVERKYYSWGLRSMFIANCGMCYWKPKYVGYAFLGTAAWMAYHRDGIFGDVGQKSVLCNVWDSVSVLAKLFVNSRGSVGTTLARLKDSADITAVVQPNEGDSGHGGQGPSGKGDDNGGDTRKTPNEGEEKSDRNSLGYQKEGATYKNTTPHGSNTTHGDDDGDIRANVNGRVIHTECGIGVVGQSVDDNECKQICGVISLPVSCEPNVYAQHFSNVQMAVQERITKKQRPFTATDADKARIGRMVSASMGMTQQMRGHALFSTSRVLDVLAKSNITDMASKKWTQDRMQNAIETLCQSIDPKFQFSTSVKLEPMPEGKAPRMLIADGDMGQVMSLMTIHCIETLIKTHLPNKGIKGKAKPDAVRNVMEECRIPNNELKKHATRTVFEGDGSAWDTTCSAKIRAIVENPVIKHVCDIIVSAIDAVPASWALNHSAACESETLKLRYSKRAGEVHNLVIDAIRRSGHRGTSCLNWWVNYVCWHSAIFKEPERFLDPTVKRGEDIEGKMRWLASAFEGDDSFLVTTPAITNVLDVSILQFWERIGFNMKIEKRDNRALFVGYYIGLDGKGPRIDDVAGKKRYMMMPEIDRCFSRSGVSCSPAMIQAFKQGNAHGCRRLSGSAAMSRAFEFAGLSPTISTKYLTYAEDLGYELTHDLIMRADLDDKKDGGLGAVKDDLSLRIHVMNNSCYDEKERFEATGFGCDSDELARFIDHPWDYDTLVNWETFRESLPVAWRQ